MARVYVYTDTDRILQIAYLKNTVQHAILEQQKNTVQHGVPSDF
jgi:hypothetical protein